MRRILLLISALFILGRAANAAIAFDSAADMGHILSASTMTTASYTATGSNLCLFVEVTQGAGNDVITGITWGSSTLTAVGSVVNGSIFLQVWKACGVTAGSNTFNLTSTNNGAVDVLVASYSGASSSLDLSGNSNTFSSNTANLGNANVSTSFTTSISNDWVLLFGNSVNCYFSLSGTSGTPTSRVCSGAHVGSIVDNAATTSVGTYTYQTDVAGQGSSYPNVILMLALSPAGTPGTMTVSPRAIPNQNASNIVLSLTGTNTSWNNSTTVFTISGVSNVTLVSQNVSSSTAATVTVTTGAGVGTLTVAETVTGSASNTVMVSANGGGGGGGGCSVVGVGQ